MHQITKPSRDEIKLVDYVALQSSSDDTDPRGTGQYLKSGFTTEISSGLIDALIEHLEPHPERGGMAFFQQAGGEIGRVAADATAFPHRYATHNMTIGAVWRSGTDADAHINWARQYWKEVDQFTSGFYTNDAYSVKKSRAQTNYLGNYDRLVSIKNTYDPENLFRVNTNILPSKRSA